VGTKRKTITFLLTYPEVDENSCQECGVNYDDDYQEAWIGCDNEEFGRWFRYWWAGFEGSRAHGSSLAATVEVLHPSFILPSYFLPLINMVITST